MTYLGIIVCRNLNDYITLKIKPLIQNIRQKLLVWKKMNLSMAARLVMFKMIILPQVLFNFQNSPVVIPNKYRNILNTLLRKFLWNRKRARISLVKLYPQLNKGGLALRDFQSYFLAAQWQNMIDHDILMLIHILKENYEYLNVYNIWSLLETGIFSKKEVKAQYPMFGLIHWVWEKTNGLTHLRWLNRPQKICCIYHLSNIHHT
ncbi:hypothetical protein GDO81_001103 [Engystomops pustulosus]|uniref:Reverse transcriptase n=1 Tax=Engystomops pustulosus TaxID=76066 RepID=A0AAV7DAC5_ENGPU|nr:hypothetical protein GDO81_001103 [Engystomops pustulosus]